MNQISAIPSGRATRASHRARAGLGHPAGIPIVVDRARYWHAFDLHSVVLADGRLGIGETEAEAIAAAQKPGAQNVSRP